MDRSRERSRLPTCRDPGYAQGSSFWAVRVERRKLGLKGTCLGKGVQCPLWVESASTGRSKGGWREGGSETGSGFFKGVGGESGTGVMSLPVGPRPPLPPEGPPLTHTASAAQVATSRATPEIPPPLGGVGATWAVGNRVAPAGKGHRGYRSHARGATPRCSASQKLEGWGYCLRGSTDIEDSEPGKVEELEELGMRLGT